MINLFWLLVAAIILTAVVIVYAIIKNRRGGDRYSERDRPRHEQGYYDEGEYDRQIQFPDGLKRYELVVYPDTKERVMDILLKHNVDPMEIIDEEGIKLVFSDSRNFKGLSELRRKGYMSGFKLRKATGRLELDLEGGYREVKEEENRDFFSPPRADEEKKIIRREGKPSIKETDIMQFIWNMLDQEFEDDTIRKTLGIDQKVIDAVKEMRKKNEVNKGKKLDKVIIVVSWVEAIPEEIETVEELEKAVKFKYGKWFKELEGLEMVFKESEEEKEE